MVTPPSTAYSRPDPRLGSIQFFPSRGSLNRLFGFSWSTSLYYIIGGKLVNVKGSDIVLSLDQQTGGNV